MRRDIIMSVFLFFVLFALVFVYFFPVYFTFDRVVFRSVSVIERIMSVVYILLWFLLCAYTAYFKKITCLFGGVLYSVMAYLPGIIIPRLAVGTLGNDPSLAASIIDAFMRRIYELINAPMVGISVLFPPEKSIGISKLMLPVLVISYVVTQIFRFYRNAYLADQLLLNDATDRIPVPISATPTATRPKGSAKRTAAFGLSSLRAMLFKEHPTQDEPEEISDHPATDEGSTDPTEEEGSEENPEETLL